MSGPVRSVPDEEADATGVRQTPRPGRQAMLLAALCIGVLLMAIQLWFLTIALDLFFSGERSGAWLLAVFSGLVFLGGIVALRLLGGPVRVGRG